MILLAWDQAEKEIVRVQPSSLAAQAGGARPVAEVAEKLGLSQEQVWYRFHRARREMEEIGSSPRARARVPGVRARTYPKKT